VKRDFSRSRSCERDSNSLKLSCSPITVLSSCDGKTQRLSNARVRSLSAIERLFFACFDLFQCILLITSRAQARARASVALGHSVPCGSPSARATAARWQRLTHSCGGARLRRQRRNGAVTLWRRRALRRALRRRPKHSGGRARQSPRLRSAARSAALRSAAVHCGSARLRSAARCTARRHPRVTSLAHPACDPRHCCCGGAANCDADSAAEADAQLRWSAAVL
jgi:hypothetical protein